MTSCCPPQSGCLCGEGPSPRSIESSGLMHVWVRWECLGASPEQGKVVTVPCKALCQLHHFALDAVLWCRLWGTIQGALDGPRHPLRCPSRAGPVDVVFLGWGSPQLLCVGCSLLLLKEAKHPKPLLLLAWGRVCADLAADKPGAMVPTWSCWA